MSARWPAWLLLIAAAAVGTPGCRVVRYPAERYLPDPVPDAPPEVLAEVAARRPTGGGAGHRATLERVVENGRALVGRAEVRFDGITGRADCSGFVVAAFASAGITLGGGDGGVEALFRALERDGRIHRDPEPQPGDLVFFSNTVDRDGDGVLDDELTHVGYVDSVDEQGTTRFLHYMGGAVRLGRLNLSRPDEHADADTGAILNDYLRRRRADDPAGIPYLAAQLFAGFGRVPDVDD